VGEGVPGEVHGGFDGTRERTVEEVMERVNR
jgi:hypothetical protein